MIEIRSYCTFISLSLVIFLLLSSCKTEYIEYDVCIYGGTASGVIAAYSASKMGKKVVLVEPGEYLGGMTTGGLGATDIGNKFAITGLARKFYRDLGKHYGKFEQWRFAPTPAFELMDKYIAETNVEVIYNKRIITSNVINTRIKSIVLEDSKNSESTPLLKISAKQYIDCTYEGDLMAKSNVSYFTGRESNEFFNETLNGVQLNTTHQFPDGVDPYIIEGDSSSGYCWGISENQLQPNGMGDKSIQAYNFRLCWTKDKNNMIPFSRPETYDSTKYELLARAMKVSGSSNISDYLLIKKITDIDDKYDINNRGPLSTDMIGMNHNYPDGDYETRDKIWKDHEEYTKGLIYFITHDERVPEDLRNAVSEYGWAKDEYVNNNHFPTQLYIRESRRLNGEYVMTQNNCLGYEFVEDGIGMAAYGMDSHNCQRLVVNGMVKNEGDVQYHGFIPYHISYKSITPKKEECTNLLVPVCVSSSHIAFGSIRMEPVFMMLGQSAGMAAAMAIDSNKSVQEIDVKSLRRMLKEDPYLDGSTPEILVDDSDIDKVKRSGGWAKQYGGYKQSYMLSFNNSQDVFFTLTPIVKKSGKYDVYFYCTPLNNIADELCIRVNHQFGEELVNINPNESVNDWSKLGTFNFREGNEGSFTIDGALSEGAIFADAILMVPTDM